MEAEVTSLECVVLPPCSADAGRQVSRLSSKAMKHFHLCSGQCIFVSTPANKALCQVHQIKHSGGMAVPPHLQYCSDVVLKMAVQSKNPNSSADSQQHRLTLQPIPCEDSEIVTVKLVVNDGGKYVGWEENDGLKAELAQKCVRCLKNLCVTSECTVDLSHSRLAKAYGICHCVVVSCVQDGEAIDSSKAVKITERTVAQIAGIQSLDFYSILQEPCSEKLRVLGGVQEECSLLADLLLMPQIHKQAYKSFGLPRSSGVLLHGPPGCGKTSLVRQVAHKCGAVVVTINGPELISSDPGESEANLKAVIDRAVKLSQEGPCILFIDEVDAICQRRKQSESKHNARFTSAVLSGLDGIPKECGLLVVAATNRPSALDPAVRQPGRLDQEVLISVPSHSQRREILDVHLAGVPLAPEIDLDWLAGATGGHVGADLAKVCAEATRRAVSASMGSSLQSEWKVTLADFEASLHLVHPSLRQGADCVVDVQPVRWEDIGGLDQVKKKIRQAVEWPLLYPDAYQRMGLPLARGVLLYGPPGCGKTRLVRAAASAIHVTFLSLSCAQVYSPFVGDSEQKVVEAFQKARALAPSILFLDEIDAIVGKRSEASSGHSVQERVLSTLLNEMDGVGTRLDEKTSSKEISEKELEGNPSVCQPHLNKKVATKEVRDRSHVLVVAATNRLDMVDDALLRPGRMDHLIYVPPPDRKARQKILEVHSQQMRMVGVDMSQIAADTEGYSGADLENICREAALCALTESLDADFIGPAHFQHALDTVKPSLNMNETW
ncbi:hypothetical protein BaRGS_00033621 [Batillaria attramentaria]|uniref:AAA+ ATPase domain-containing protein n=1 Tax=Batillaria attramentaria TaxID=370345 RepID=A0ABD0JJK5_9CAEN